MTSELDGLASRALAALCNGVYQGVLFTLVVAFALKGLRRASAATRYVLEFIALAIVAILPVVHFLSDSAGLAARRDASVSTLVGPELGVDDTRLQEPVPGLGFGASLGDAAWASDSTEGELTPTRESVRNLPDLELGEASVVRLPREVARGAAALWTDDGGTGATGGEAGQTLAGQPPPRQHWQVRASRAATFWVVGAWLVFAAWRLARLLWQYGALWRLRQRSVAPPEPLARLFAELRPEVGVRRRAGLYLSDELSSPVAAGFWPAAVLMPEELAGASPADLDRILRHELAHLRRRDDWTNLVQQLVKAVFGFHPSVWWLGRRLTVDREIACDDHVLAAARSPREYALFLTDFAGRRRGRDWAAAPAAWSRNSQLKERIRMLLDTKRNTAPQSSRTHAGALGVTWGLLAALGLYTGPRLAFATEAQPDPAPAAVQAEPRGADEAPVVAFTGAGDSTSSADFTVDVNAVADVAVSLNGEGTSPDPLESPGPKPKGREARQPLAPPLPAVPAQPPIVAVQPVPPTTQPPAPAAMPPVALVGPGPGRAPRVVALAAPVTVGLASGEAKPRLPAKERTGDSFEARLDRLERQLQALLDRSGGGLDGKRVPEKAKDGDRIQEEAKRIAKQVRDELKAQAPRIEREAAESLKAWAEPGQVEMLKEQVARALEQVAGQVQQATKEAERAVIEARRTAQLEQLKLRSTPFGKGPALEQHRRALDSERQALQRQIGDIQRQLSRLEQQLDRVNDQYDRLDDEMDRLDEERESLEVEHDHHDEADADAGHDAAPIEKERQLR